MSHENNRKSIWSVPADWTRFYYKVFYFLVVISVIIALPNGSINQPATGSWVPALKAVQAFGIRFSSLMIGSAALALFITDISVMLSKADRQRWYKKGAAEGRASQHVSWLIWNRRRQRAERLGRKFTEPPPESLSD